MVHRIAGGLCGEACIAAGDGGFGWRTALRARSLSLPIVYAQQQRDRKAAGARTRLAFPPACSRERPPPHSRSDVPSARQRRDENRLYGRSVYFLPAWAPFA
eukprot:5404003-Prymnesium_polylepis.1